MGGVQKSAYAMQHAKDILLLRTMTERGRYLKTLHQSDICIGTMGLHKSSGWKTAEYVAASKGIVNEKTTLLNWQFLRRKKLFSIYNE